MKNYIAIAFLLVGNLFAARSQNRGTELVNAEKAFAQLSIDKNMQDAFLANMNDTSVVEVNGKFVKGIPLYQQQKKDTAGKLYWSPVFAAVAASGDFGYTTGPWRYHTGGQDVAFGNYASVWQKQKDGQWKFLIDLGNSFEQNSGSATDSVDMILPATITKPTAGNNDLMAIDQSFAAAINKGSNSALKNYLHPQLRILWPERMPAINKENADTLIHQNRLFSFHPQQAYIAASKDLGVVYGTCETSAAVKDKKVVHAVYMHVWRKDQNSHWQLLHETIK